MKQGLIYIYTGDGHGKSPAALGKAVLAAAQGKNVVILQFLKEKGLADSPAKGVSRVIMYKTSPPRFCPGRGRLPGANYTVALFKSSISMISSLDLPPVSRRTISPLRKTMRVGMLIMRY